MESEYLKIISNLQKLYLSDNRPWIVGYSGGKDSTMIVSMVFEMVHSVPSHERTKNIHVVCTDTGVEIPAIIERINDEFFAMQSRSDEHSLKISTHLLKRPSQQSFWVNVIGRGYPPPNRMFRWCTQRLKIDPVSEFIRGMVGQWGEAIILLGARRAESNSRAQTLDARPKNIQGLRRHDDLPRCWVATPIEHLLTDDVWNYLLERPNVWGGDNHSLYQLYRNASGGECPLVVDESTPSCGNSRFGCWTCTVVNRDKASEGLLASGDLRMKEFLRFREKLLEIREPQNGYRDAIRKNGEEGAGPVTMAGRKLLLEELLLLQQNTGITTITEEEMHWIQVFWKSARNPDNGTGVADLIFQNRGERMPALHEDQLNETRCEVAKELGVSVEILVRLVEKIQEYSESHRKVNLDRDLKQILQDALREENKNV